MISFGLFILLGKFFSRAYSRLGQEKYKELEYFHSIQIDFFRPYTLTCDRPLIQWLDFIYEKSAFKG